MIEVAVRQTKVKLLAFFSLSPCLWCKRHKDRQHGFRVKFHPIHMAEPIKSNSLLFKYVALLTIDIIKAARGDNVKEKLPETT